MSRTSIVQIVIFLFGLAPVWSAAAPPPPAADAYLPESAFEFKPVVEGTRVEHEFTLVNRGAAPLSILEVTSG